MSTEKKNIFEWDSQKYTTYVGAMDKEHEVLVQIMNQLYTLNEKGAPKSELLKVIEQLGRKTKEHFASEEKYLATVPKYTGLTVHKKIHQNLLENYGRLQDEFRQSQNTKLTIEFFNFLKVWLTAHICGIDRKYGEIVKAG
jgi:hemerythrin-like metal-binding protein